VEKLPGNSHQEEKRLGANRIKRRRRSEEAHGKALWRLHASSRMANHRGGFFMISLG